MFDSHSQLAIPGESHFIVTMARQRERYEIDGSVTPAFLDDVLANARFRQWQLPSAAVRETLVGVEPGSFADAVRAVFAAYAAHRGKPLYGDKTPGYVRNLPLLAELFPEARFLHIVRDGRDVALSLMEMDWATAQAPEGLETLARFWRTNVELAFEARDELGPRRYREIRYERLIDDAESVVRDACAFLDLPFEPVMLSYHERADQLAGSLRNKDDHRRIRLPPTKGLRDWRTQMSRDDLSRFELVAGEALERAGYGRVTA